ncbi:uncharacterized protein LOC114466559 [Gouania willdenowi]|uniref:uncharacterized protein LOC114466559 n=1 Tax=Gouania willdenowi TaxID=441366 RepID=UPI00105539D4|nr:uncharacterized protein LOC114466559 [Gouania willdenowi]
MDITTERGLTALDVSMDHTENKNSFDDDQNSEDQLSQSQGVELGNRPSLSEVRKSWGFRRSTLARREFIDEVVDLTNSPAPVRRGRGRRTNQTTAETCSSHSTALSTRSVIEDLQWSAPSSPTSEDSKPASEPEASAEGSLDPSLWHDVGSAFHTAFSLLGGDEGLSMPMPEALVVPDMLEAPGFHDIFNSQALEDSEVLDNVHELELSEQLSPGSVISIPNQEDSDDMTLMQIKEQLESNIKEGSTKAKAGRGGRGRARGRGRGRGRDSMFAVSTATNGLMVAALVSVKRRKNTSATLALLRSKANTFQSLAFRLSRRSAFLKVLKMKG